MSENRARFAEAVSLPDCQINLAHAALIFAADAYPCLDIEGYLSRLDFLAAAVQERIGDQSSPCEIVKQIADFLHREQRFAGNLTDYSDPRNSYLNEVMDRRLGIPISLSVLWIEIARRIGIPIVGVGMPGHFIVKWEVCAEEGGEILIDPFESGCILSVERCKHRLQRVFGSPVFWRKQYLSRATNKEILARMLRNLKVGCMQQGDCSRTLNVIEHLLIVQPDSAEDIRDLGLVHLKRKDIVRGVECLERYLKFASRAHDADTVRDMIRSLRNNVARWN